MIEITIILTIFTLFFCMIIGIKAFRPQKEISKKEYPNPYDPGGPLYYQDDLGYLTSSSSEELTLARNRGSHSYQRWLVDIANYERYSNSNSKYHLMMQRYGIIFENYLKKHKKEKEYQEMLNSNF